MKNKLFFYALLFLLIPVSVYALQVFPGAEGYGTNTRAAYGGSGIPTIYVVNTLIDNKTTPVKATINGTTVYKGSLRSCLLDTAYTSVGQGRIILFEKSGYIDAATSDLGLIKIQYPYTTIAGQSAPSPGVSTKQAGFFVNTHDVLIQHIRTRNGTGEGRPSRDSRDGITVYNYSPNPEPTYNIVIDHCSFAWSLDELIDVGGGMLGTHDVTVSNSIAAESIYDPATDPDYVSRGPYLGYNVKNVCMLRNIMAHNYIRNPLVATGAQLLAINNFIYGYSGIGMELGGGSGNIYASFIKNYIKKNNQSSSHEVYFESGWGASSKVYLFGNMYENKDDSVVGPGSGVDDQWTLLTDGLANREDYKVYSSPLAVNIPLSITQWDAEDIYGNMIGNSIPTKTLHTVGAWPISRDSVDTRIIAQLTNRTGSLIASENDVGGFPVLEENTKILNIPSNPHSDDDGDGYTNLEEWLHELAAKVEGRNEIVARPLAPQGLSIKIN